MQHNIWNQHENKRYTEQSEGHFCEMINRKSTHKCLITTSSSSWYGASQVTEALETDTMAACLTLKLHLILKFLHTEYNENLWKPQYRIFFHWKRKSKQGKKKKKVETQRKNILLLLWSNQVKNLKHSHLWRNMLFQEKNNTCGYHDGHSTAFKY